MTFLIVLYSCCVAFFMGLVFDLDQRRARGWAFCFLTSFGLLVFMSSGMWCLLE